MYYKSLYQEVLRFIDQGQVKTDRLKLQDLDSTLPPMNNASFKDSQFMSDTQVDIGAFAKQIWPVHYKLECVTADTNCNDPKDAIF